MVFWCRMKTQIETMAGMCPACRMPLSDKEPKTSQIPTDQFKRGLYSQLQQLQTITAGILSLTSCIPEALGTNEERL